MTGEVHVNTGGGSWLIRVSGECPLCGKTARMVSNVSGSPWYAPKMACVECGGSWDEDGPLPPPFRRGWRVEARRRALTDWNAAPPLGTVVVRDWDAGGYVTGYSAPPDESEEG